MALIKVLVAGFAGLAVSAWETPEKFKPLVEACEGVDALKDCSAQFKGVCKTKHGERFCARARGKDCLWSKMHEFKHKLMSHFGMHGHEKRHGWPRLLGDCGAKADGEACTVSRTGRCVPSGKCPVFQGQMVCKPSDARPPEFVTKPCDGKQDGDRCHIAIIPGKCFKGKYDDYLACKTWPWTSSKKEQETSEEATVVV
mmetsp:Transcript_123320/g.383776  ORF Transcript_123320/g.383776 Transcript_123320/m.383776 type:complete len:199 (-) Transcript_123320:115-711(-)